MRLPSPPRCPFLRCRNFQETGHHITYRPDVVEGICQRHHRQITLVNWQEANRRGHGLSNAERWTIYRRWKRGKLKVRWTNEARNWLDKYWRPNQTK